MIKLRKIIILISAILLLDQVSKFLIKTHMTLGQEIRVLGDWFLIHFTENNGMAFGLEFAGDNGKLYLTIFRIIAAIFIGYYIWHLNKHKAHWLFVVSIALIFSGAVGNIIDSVFYGVLFSNSSFFSPATFLPPDGGYGTLFHGRVVDMFYFPIIKTTYPGWFPFWGGQEFIFFRPVFNIADSSITTGVFILIIFQKKFFKPSNPTPPETEVLSSSVSETVENPETIVEKE